MGRRWFALLISVAVIALAVACSTRTPDSEPLEWDLDDSRVSYLGPEGTYTEEATQFVFPDSAVLVPRATVPDAISDVVSGASDYAVILKSISGILVFLDNF